MPGVSVCRAIVEGTSNLAIASGLSEARADVLDNAARDSDPHLRPQEAVRLQNVLAVEAVARGTAHVRVLFAPLLSIK